MSVWAVVVGGALLALLGWGVARLLAARSASSQRRAGLQGGPHDGSHAGAHNPAATGQSQADPATPRVYSPGNVGNDASARPWESAFDSPSALAPAGSAAFGNLPEEFDAVAFLQASKANFVSLQDAWDRADIPSLRAMMTDDMLDQIQSQLIERERRADGQPNKTEVVMIDARLLGLEDLGQGHMASVEFSGMVREDGSAGPSPFREIWSIARAKSGSSGWLVAGVQALQ